MKRQVHASVLLFLAWAPLPLHSMVCDCSYAGPPCKAFANTPTVFVGRVVPNSWGFSETPAPELVDEERLIREPVSEADRKRLMLDYSGKLLTTIVPHRSITYFRGFTFGRNIRKEIDSAAKQYLIVGLNGALRMTDGQTAEEMIFAASDEGAGGARWVAIRLPAHWQLVSQDSFVVEERP